MFGQHIVKQRVTIVSLPLGEKGNLKYNKIKRLKKHWSKILTNG